MMAPDVYRDARMAAEHFILAEIIGREDDKIWVKLARAFRGDLPLGSILILEVSIAPEGERPLGGTIYVQRTVVENARYVEAFLHGQPPKVVRGQIKFLTHTSRDPSGDPSRDSFLW